MPSANAPLSRHVLKGDNVMSAGFPFSPQTALAYLYVEKNAKDGMSPAELYAMYEKAFKEIQDEFNRLKTVKSSMHS